jgi:hypothetical protein
MVIAIESAIVGAGDLDQIEGEILVDSSVMRPVLRLLVPAPTDEPLAVKRQPGEVSVRETIRHRVGRQGSPGKGRVARDGRVG